MVPWSLLPLGKERTHVGLGLEQQATFEEAKIPGKQSKALSVSQAGPTFGLDVPETPEVMGWAWRLRQQKVRVLALEVGTNPIYPPKGIGASSVHSAASGGASWDGRNHSSQWTELRMVCLVLTMTLCTEVGLL